MRSPSVFLRRLGRHWRWGREQGFGRLIEEDELNPISRLSNSYRKWRWRSANPVRHGDARAVFLVGVQRSGTNMLVRGLQTAPEFEVYNENNKRAFENYRLRPDADIAEIVERSRHLFVLFKPLIDSHRVDHLLDDLPLSSAPRALWAYRNMEGRVRSSVAKFGDTNLRALREINAGTGLSRWEAQRLSLQSMELIRSLTYDRMTPESGSALFWYVRNSLFFELDLHKRPDVLLVSYDSFVSNPESSMRTVCEHIGFDWNPRLTAHVTARARGPQSPVDIDPRIRTLCDDLQDRLATTVDERRRKLATHGAAGDASSS
jgi:hypothetical protein